MKHLVLCVTIVAGLLVAGCSKPADTQAVKQQLEQKTHAFAEAVSKQDINGLMADYWNSPELAAYYPDANYQGYDAVKKSWEGFFGMMAVKSFSFPEVHTDVSGDGTLAYQWGLYDMTLQPKGGGPEIKAPGRFSEVWKNMNGSWVIVVDHASSPLPPPPAAADSTKKM